MTTRCDTYWGSHGCDLTSGHPGPHECGATDPDGLCSQASIDHTGMAHVRYYPLTGGLAGEKVYLMPALGVDGPIGAHR